MASSVAHKNPDPIDCVVRLVTPERIIVVHPLAGPFRRFAAYLIDLGLLLLSTAILAFATFLLLALSGGSAAVLGPAFVAFFVLSWGYGAFCEGVFNGQTLGKLCLGIRVVSDRGVPISGAAGDLAKPGRGHRRPLPLFFQIGLASMTLSSAISAAG